MKVQFDLEDEGSQALSSAPAAGLVDVTPANADLPGGVCRSLLVVTAGELTIETKDGSTPSAFAMPAGSTVPVAVKQVRAATTATVKAFYGYGG